MKFNEGFLARMREATKLLHTEGPMAATEAIQRALHGEADDGTAGTQPGVAERAQNPSSGSHRPRSGARTSNGEPNLWTHPHAHADIEDVEAVDVPDMAKSDANRGRFISASCTSHAGTRRYKLYIPSGYKNEPLPLVVMLHGCTQNPDDFAAGTEMNKVAEENNCFVAYPEQDKGSNATLCWNWFLPAHQQQGRGEPAIIAQITHEIAQKHSIDSKRIYVAGLSAGGAMAAIMAATYPEIYAAVGIHSGLPYKAARDMPSAFAAMKRGRAKAPAMKAMAQATVALPRQVPAIVFHGDVDTTVSPENADLILAQCGGPAAAASTIVQEGAANGRSYTRTVMYGGTGSPVAEKWLIHGAGHAWAGGSRSGSYADPQGPSAAREMLRFFKEHERQ